MIFNPSNVLSSNLLYLVLIDGSVQSQDPGGVFIQGAMSQIDVDGDGSNEGYGWYFSTSYLICQINFVSILPPPDVFTSA